MENMRFFYLLNTLGKKKAHHWYAQVSILYAIASENAKKNRNREWAKRWKHAEYETRRLAQILNQESNS